MAALSEKPRPLPARSNRRHNRVFGASRVSVRLSPRMPYNDMGDSDLEGTYMFAVEALETRKVGILHFMESAQLPGVSSCWRQARKAVLRLVCRKRWI